METEDWGVTQLVFTGGLQSKSLHLSKSQLCHSQNKGAEDRILKSTWPMSESVFLPCSPWHILCFWTPDRTAQCAMEEANDQDTNGSWFAVDDLEVGRVSPWERRQALFCLHHPTASSRILGANTTQPSLVLLLERGSLAGWNPGSTVFPLQSVHIG